MLQCCVRALVLLSAGIGSVGFVAAEPDLLSGEEPTARQVQQALIYGDRFQTQAMPPPAAFTTPPMAIPRAYTWSAPAVARGSLPAWYNPYYEYCRRFPYVSQCRGRYHLRRPPAPRKSGQEGHPHRD